MEPIELTTPHGYKVYLKPELTYGEYSTFQKMLAQDMTLDPLTGKSQEIKGSAVFDATEKVLEFLIVKILDPKGEEVAPNKASVDAMPAKDGMAVFAKVNEITAEAGVDDSKKK